MARHKVEITGVNTSSIKVLKSDEMTELFIKFQNGDMQAREQLVNGNLKLVLSILKKFNHRTDNMDDLFQIGCIGLLKAIDNFDLGHNVRFSTYAVPMIVGEVKRYLRDNNSIRISRSLKDLAFKALRLKEELTNKYGKEPDLAEVSKLLETNEIDIIIAIDALKEPVSMFEPIYNDGGDTIYLADQLESKSENASNWDIAIALDSALDVLKNKEKQILIDRFIVGKTQMEIADEIGISQAQVSRLEKNAVDHVKKLVK
ncbi:MAG: RNA polymerase sporulation sigma factor SigG [Bacilli bacterium]|nr:RNA polymerase sporulation sigma factor SigG [Bacilli bacterium]MDD3305322.1 RNA polymerase sporulation sigma factor SigG [Bacilli bacterium]MDD4053557.1 RNA polymerase sporulation sigma factor SigG [Bacilli bacterium]MDD4411476.1 RNA polymerase sporulation sigma factor SigG [Bacilli bacterium]